ncbi:phosphate ABC transporter, inner membrane subunit PstC [Flexistipes sinusarabici DSM 4947]|uniref:Phosphate transport system permease protein n=1 Tax=Flexistipes sinusarabici (strain ATCC 49648 / DSM 4947 / MAS 10) TaxID=717231 RepID=F8E3T3_FLESM|nr:phosphate ABC transporter permease subunit PstC [Flexistipes sinusarabici]AEI15435.1 phosphate ABC transporter, inner membrane subunit PstC [Flexistipes sinusarabici DSM 4947]
MSLGNLIFIVLGGIVPLAYIAYIIASRKASVWENQNISIHSRPYMHGWFVVVIMGVPSMVAAVAAGLLHVTGIYSVSPFILIVACIVLVASGFAFGLKKISPDFRARNKVENVIKWSLIAASLVSIMTTVGIVLSILFEALRFFDAVGFWNFITGTKWNPDTAFLSGAGRGGEQAANADFGAVPIFAGTFMITFIAMCVAVPIGLFSAIFLAEYATPRFRKIMKPLLEVLAGIPTVVYGFFAAITVSPLVVKAAAFFGLEAAYTNALSPGLVMGIMIIPLMSSLSDDVINAVPHSLREGSLALGTTVAETTKRVILPAALPGIVSAFLLSVSRAIGETMIVVMAAGLRPNLTANPLEGMTTVTVRIVDSLTGDQSFDSLETLSAFGLGFVLLILTLILNIISTIIVRKFREKYE